MARSRLHARCILIVWMYMVCAKGEGDGAKGLRAEVKVGHADPLVVDPWEPRADQGKGEFSNPRFEYPSRWRRRFITGRENEEDQRDQGDKDEDDDVQALINEEAEVFRKIGFNQNGAQHVLEGFANDDSLNAPESLTYMLKHYEDFAELSDSPIERLVGMGVERDTAAWTLYHNRGCFQRSIDELLSQRQLLTPNPFIPPEREERMMEKKKIDSFCNELLQRVEDMEVQGGQNGKLSEIDIVTKAIDLMRKESEETQKAPNDMISIERSTPFDNLIDIARWELEARRKAEVLGRRKKKEKKKISSRRRQKVMEKLSAMGLEDKQEKRVKAQKKSKRRKERWLRRQMNSLAMDLGIKPDKISSNRDLTRKNKIAASTSALSDPSISSSLRENPKSRDLRRDSIRGVAGELYDVLSVEGKLGLRDLDLDDDMEAIEMFDKLDYGTISALKDVNEEAIECMFHEPQPVDRHESDINPNDPKGEDEKLLQQALEREIVRLLRSAKKGKKRRIGLERILVESRIAGESDFSKPPADAEKDKAEGIVGLSEWFQENFLPEKSETANHESKGNSTGERCRTCAIK